MLASNVFAACVAILITLPFTSRSHGIFSSRSKTMADISGCHGPAEGAGGGGGGGVCAGESDRAYSVDRQEENSAEVLEVAQAAESRRAGRKPSISSMTMTAHHRIAINKDDVSSLLLLVADVPRSAVLTVINGFIRLLGGEHLPDAFSWTSYFGAMGTVGLVLLSNGSHTNLVKTLDETHYSTNGMKIDAR